MSEFDVVLDTFDLLMSGFNQKEFIPIKNSSVNYPIDIYHDDDALYLDVAVPGRPRDDIEVLTEGDILRIIVKDKRVKNPLDDNYDYVVRKIKLSDIDLRWRINMKFDLDEMKVSLNNGLLKILIPTKNDRKVKKHIIK